MNCWCQGNKTVSSKKKMREIAKKAARMEKSIFILFMREDNSFGYVKENEPYKGAFIEYIYP